MPDMGMQSISFAANSNNKIIKKLIGLGLDCCDSKNIFDCKDIIKPDSEKDGMIYQTIWVQHSSQREILPLSVEGEGSEIKVNMLLDGEEGVKNITRKIKYKAGPLWVNSEGKESEIIEVGDRFQLSRSAAWLSFNSYSLSRRSKKSAIDKYTCV